MAANAGPLLSKINSPDDLKKLSLQELLPLCDELRQFIIDEVSCNPGHFGASLGVVELTVALHYVLNTPKDLIVWDVGHQAYAHKILTGRKSTFHTNRKMNGLSGFPTRSESEYDPFGVGHSSTSISAALGMSVSDDVRRNNRQVIAVIGDGAMTGGMAFEALNNAGALRSNMTIILNDNRMAISDNSGAMKEYLIDIATSRTYNRVKDDVWRFLGKMNRVGGANAQSMIQKINNGLKSIVMKQSNLFESLNIRYFGPVDGHDVVYLTKILEDLSKIEGPKLLHVQTQKGKGFAAAEKDQTLWHAPAKFNKITGEFIKSKHAKPTPPKYQTVFGETLLELAEMNDKIVGITPAMSAGSSLDIMMKKYPNRIFDVGIAEQHAVTFAAGMATQGMIPFCAIYSTFAQRAYDQIIHDVAIQNLHVVFCVDRAGLVGQDGVTHHGLYDIPAFRAIPNMTLSAPMDEIQMRHLMYTAQLSDVGPFVIRYPRGYGMHLDWKAEFEEIPIGKARLMESHENAKLAVLSYGAVGNSVRYAAKTLRSEGVFIDHYDMRFAKPLDMDVLQEIAKKHTKIITIEDGAITGGFGSAVLESITEIGWHGVLKRLGAPDKLIHHGEQNELREICGYDIKSIEMTIRELVQ
ncbi:MAG: 1-deoxy-D-xylulose-5-phosphate synthase [Bacteroidales bacterium]|jgi:1-deoxy-D-xylulose-5-phosphate synthase|nr:1-deoxy-D-xylulose-5-phosphate synthase [Bacteroidales bacterium]